MISMLFLLLPIYYNISLSSKIFRKFQKKQSGNNIEEREWIPRKTKQNMYGREKRGEQRGRG